MYIASGKNCVLGANWYGRKVALLHEVMMVGSALQHNYTSPLCIGFVNRTGDLEHRINIFIYGDIQHVKST